MALFQRQNLPDIPLNQRRGDVKALIECKIACNNGSDSLLMELGCSLTSDHRGSSFSWPKRFTPLLSSRVGSSSMR
jgi:hypothetical protein